MTSTFTSGNDARSEFDRLTAGTNRGAYNYAYRLTGNRDDAEDLVQEAYLRAFSALNKYNRALPFLNWLYRIITNLNIDRLRRRNCKAIANTLSLDHYYSPDGDAGIHLEIPDQTFDPERLLIHRTMDERTSAALNSLPDVFRQAVLLRDLDRLSYEEIAEACDITLGTVRSRIHRGRRGIKDYLARHRGAPT